MIDKPKNRRTALVTNVLHYAGPGSVNALLDEGFSVYGHDFSFTNEEKRTEWEAERSGVKALAQQEPEALVTEMLKDAGAIDAIVSNDLVTITSGFEKSDIDMFESMIQEGMVWPYRIAKAALVSMKKRRKGSIIFITSASARYPLPQVPHYSAVRAGTTALAVALGRAYGKYNIQINAIGPAWFDNPTYFPKGWDENISRKEQLDNEVTLRRLGKQDEMGRLVAFIASGAAMPITAQYIDFCGNSRP